MRKLSLISFLLIVLVALAPTALAQDEAEPFAITILHTNDTHASHQPNNNGDGGAARQATVMKQIAAEVENVLLLDGGDRFTGTLYHTLYLGQDQVQIMNALGYDAMTLGNHEFDNGDQVLADFIDGLNFPVVSTNIDFSESPILKDKVERITILEVGGEQIGVIGLTTADTPTISSPGDELVFSDDYVNVVNTAAAELTDQGVNKIVLLTHTGINVDLAIIEQIVGVDVYIGGHSHTLYSNTYQSAVGDYPLEFTNAAGEPVLYVQAGSNNLYLGRLDLEFDPATGVITDFDGDTILLSRYITPDPEIEAILGELAGPVDELANQPIGATTDVFLTGNRAVCRVEECNLGNLIADAMRAETGAQIAIMNGGGIRADIDEGEITLGEVLTVHPFGNLIATFDLKGADVIAALENGVSTLALDDNGRVVREGAAGRFPQVSGLRYTIDPTQDPGSRIVSVEVQGEDGTFAPIDPEAVYSVVTNNFMRTGGDGYTVLAENAINPYDFGRVDYEATRDYLIANSPITIGVEGRITYVNAEVVPLQ